MERDLDSKGSSSSNNKSHQNERDDTSIPIIASLTEPISPPRRRSAVKKDKNVQSPSYTSQKAGPRSQSPANLAAIEAGREQVKDHLEIFSSRLGQSIRLDGFLRTPRLQIADWGDLYRRNKHPQGRHFLIHQHDHPIAGPHYDLRLQFSETSSVSWSIMYGLPGDPNSRRLNRNATETRVHCLWNHLIETASIKTGSMIIWDTGEYEILPYQVERSQPETDDSRSESSDTSSHPEDKTDSEKLQEAFQNRKIRLRLHGSRLPPNYTILLRRDKSSEIANRTHIPQKRRRRTRTPARAARTPQSTPSSPDSSSLSNDDESSHPTPGGISSSQAPDSDTPKANKTADSDEEIDLQIRVNNAYPGSTNSIGSVHQRRWFITMDRLNSGFIEDTNATPGKNKWIPKRDQQTEEIITGFEPFYVRGPDFERSVVTGRLGKDVLEDEGVQGFMPRRGWRPVVQ